MELDDVEPLAARTMRAQLRHALVCHARQFLRLRRSHVAAHIVEVVTDPARQRRRQVDDQRIGPVGIDTGPQARLVEFGEFLFGGRS